MGLLRIGVGGPSRMSLRQPMVTESDVTGKRHTLNLSVCLGSLLSQQQQFRLPEGLIRRMPFRSSTGLKWRG